MADFMFLYRGSPNADWATTSPEARQQNMQLWLAWMRDLDTRGHMKDNGQPLEPVGKVVKDKGALITDGPFAESKDLVGGFSLISATDLAQASELAKGCPILHVPGGMVEVRPVMKMEF